MADPIWIEDLCSCNGKKAISTVLHTTYKKHEPTCLAMRPASRIGDYVAGLQRENSRLKSDNNELIAQINNLKAQIEELKRKEAQRYIESLPEFIDQDRSPDRY